MNGLKDFVENSRTQGLALRIEEVQTFTDVQDLYGYANFAHGTVESADWLPEKGAIVNFIDWRRYVDQSLGESVDIINTYFPPRISEIIEETSGIFSFSSSAIQDIHDAETKIIVFSGGKKYNRKFNLYDRICYDELLSLGKIKFVDDTRPPLNVINRPREGIGFDSIIWGDNSMCQYMSDLWKFSKWNEQRESAHENIGERIQHRLDYRFQLLAAFARSTQCGQRRSVMRIDLDKAFVEDTVKEFSKSLERPRENNVQVQFYGTVSAAEIVQSFYNNDTLYGLLIASTSNAQYDSSEFRIAFEQRIERVVKVFPMKMLLSRFPTKNRWNRVTNSNTQETIASPDNIGIRNALLVAASSEAMSCSVSMVNIDVITFFKCDFVIVI